MTIKSKVLNKIEANRKFRIRIGGKPDEWTTEEVIELCKFTLTETISALRREIKNTMQGQLISGTGNPIYIESEWNEAIKKILTLLDRVSSEEDRQKPEVSGMEKEAE